MSRPSGEFTWLPGRDVPRRTEHIGQKLWEIPSSSSAGEHDDHYGSQPGRVKLADREVCVKRPRLRHKTEGEEKIPAYEALREDRGLGQNMLGTLLRGVSTREYDEVLPKMAATVGVSRSAISRQANRSQRRNSRTDQAIAGTALRWRGDSDVRAEDSHKPAQVLGLGAFYSGVKWGTIITLTESSKISKIVSFANIPLLIAVIGVTCLLAATLGLCFLASPSADDFCRASVRLIDLPGYIVSSYKLWTGRWTEQLVDVAILPRYGIAAIYPVFLIALIAAYFASIYSFLSNSLNNAARGVCCTEIISGAFLALFVAGMPSVGEGMFWVSGAISSVLPVFGTIYLLGWLMSRSERPTRGIHYAGVVALSLLLAGLHEMFALILCILLGMGVLATVSTGYGHRRLWIAAFASALVGCAIVCVAPGNQVRAAAYFAAAPQASWPQILSHGVRTVLNVAVRGWFLDIKLLAATLFFVWHPAVRRLCPTRVCQFGLHARVFVLSGWLLTTTLPFVLPGLIVSRVFFLPGRTFDGLYAIFLFGWFSTVFVFTRPTHDRPQDEVRIGTWTYRFAAIVFALSLLLAGNSVAIYHDLRLKATPWKAAIAIRTSAVQSARAENRLDLVVPSLMPVAPASFFYQDAEADPTYWCNVCIARYFGLKTITSEGRGGTVSGRQP